MFSPNLRDFPQYICGLQATSPEISLDGILSQVTIEHFFGEFRAFVLHDLRVALDALVERHADLPWPRKDLGVFNGGLVHDRVGAAWCIALHDMQSVGM